MTVETRVHTPVDIDLCEDCQAFWFDKYHDLQVSPDAVTSLKKRIEEQPQNRLKLSDSLRCPRCTSRLVLTHDMQRNTHFSYWRCGNDHGRFMGIVDFLREKDFIRELTPEQLQELHKKIQKVNCANCGAPIDLATTSMCAYCGSPVSMVDMKEGR